MNNFNQTEVYKFHELVFCLDSLAQKALTTSTKITYIQFLILLAIKDNPNFGIQQIANWVNLTKSAISQQVEKLVKMKFLIRNENPKDRREKQLKITTQGNREFLKAQKKCNDISENLFGVLDENERKTLQAILNKLTTVGVENMFQKTN